MVDRFRDRVVLPVHNLDGEPVGFVGRAAPHASGDTPKYLNSPRTPLFDKSALLFGLSEQHDALAAGAVPVIVEGPFDALAIQPGQPGTARHLAGGRRACGTALTATQASTLARFADHRVLVAFDADAAGQRASAAAYQLLAPHFTQLRAADFPDGGDPAQLLQAGGPAGPAGGAGPHRPLADSVLDDGLTLLADQARQRRSLRRRRPRARPDPRASCGQTTSARQAGRLAQSPRHRARRWSARR